MSDWFVYSIDIAPNPVPITLTVAASGQTVTFTASSDDITLTLSPSGDTIQKILSAVVEPVALIIAAASKGALPTALKANPQTMSTAKGFKAGDFVITPDQLSLGAMTVGQMEYVKVTGVLDMVFSS